METSPNALSLPYAPTETADIYPESDGKPMAEARAAHAETEAARLREELARLKERK